MSHAILSKRTGGSSRLRAHQLATYDEPHALRMGESFAAQWYEQHGRGNANVASPTPVPPKPTPIFAKQSLEPVTPPAPSKSVVQLNAERLAMERSSAAARAEQIRNAQIAAQRAAEEKKAIADAVWARAYASPVAIKSLTNVKPADAVWARAYSLSKSN